VEIDLVSPSLQRQNCYEDHNVAVGQAHEGIVLKTFGPGEVIEQGVWTTVFCAGDGHGSEERDGEGNRMLAANWKKTWGWKKLMVWYETGSELFSWLGTPEACLNHCLLDHSWLAKAWFAQTAVVYDHKDETVPTKLCSVGGRWPNPELTVAQRAEQTPKDPDEHLAVFCYDCFNRTMNDGWGAEKEFNGQAFGPDVLWAVGPWFNHYVAFTPENQRHLTERVNHVVFHEQGHAAMGNGHCQEGPDRIPCAMSWAYTETWFDSQWGGQHPRPFLDSHITGSPHHRDVAGCHLRR